MLYHASKVQGLKTLTPHVSTHGKSYVYAISNKVTAVCFGADKDDFDLLMDEVDGITHLYECYEGAIEKIYGGKSCSLYTVSDEGFIFGATGWEPELVCENEVAVEKEEIISNIYGFLKKAEDSGDCVIHRYAEDAEYQKMIDEEILERIETFDLSKEQVEKDPRLARFIADPFRRDKQKVKAELDKQ